MALPEDGNDAALRAGVLDDLLDASGSILALSAPAPIAERLAIAIARVPGVASARVCLPGASTDAGVFPVERCPECPGSRTSPDCAEATLDVARCPTTTAPGVRVFCLSPSARSVGLAACVVADAEAFAPYARHVESLAKVAALALDHPSRHTRAEVATRESARWHRDVFDSAADLLAVIDAHPDGRLSVVDVNPAVERAMGKSRRELVGVSVESLFAEAEVSVIGEQCRRCIETNGPVEFELDVSLAAGRRVFLATLVLASGEGGQLRRLVASAHDITRRKQTEDALRGSEERFRTLFEHSPAAIFEEDLTQALAIVDELSARGIDPAGHIATHPELARRCAEAVRVLDVNQAALALHGATDKAQLLAGFGAVFLPESYAMFPHLLLAFARGATELRGDVVLGTLAGERLNVALSAARIPGTEGRVLVSLVDITERARAEESLRKLSRAVDQSPVAILITDTTGAIEYVNPRFCETTGYRPEEVAGKNPRILSSGEMAAGQYAALWSTIAAGGEWRGELHNKKKGGELYWALTTISPILDSEGRITHFLAVEEDITEQRRLEAEFRQAQKMEAFGQLAGGVAHDFNNLLTVIRGNTELAQLEGAASDFQTEALAEVIDAAERATNLTRQLLLFGRRQAAQLRDLDLNEVVGTMTKMLQRLIGEHISLVARYAPGGALVHADAGMMEQVLMNLAVNSRDAMPRGGELRIETELVVVDEVVAQTQRGARAGAFVRMTVCDTGSGIAPEHLARVFEPFFTTKSAGHGTGLGLATVFGIVEQHGGWIGVESTPGVGTTFRIHLPRLERAANRPVESRRTEPRGGSETILVVEDDAAVRALTRRLLSARGYRVLEAASGVEALRVWAEHKAEIALVLTDMVLPQGISGRELGQRLSEDKPSVAIVYATGYTDEMLGDSSALRGTTGLVEKPFEPATLLRTVRQRLDER